ncbi:MAG: D-cysteine desulfhydrase [Sphingomonadaceae bacterium]|nr:D-cysteine desulfhydrase [Sphingomonadaceae bacterium]
MNLARYPRRRYMGGPTPIEAMPRLSAALGVECWIKRDDLNPLAGGGNKTRKLEFLVADALAEGADTLITTGAPQSNHARLTAAAAAKEGLACRLLIEERVPGSFKADATGNNLMFDLLGVERLCVVPAGTDLQAGMAAMAEAARAEGRKPYVIAGGGSTPLGALGYVACAQELMAQSFEMGVAFDRVVVASGSGGTHAGLLAGLTALNAGLAVTGINVRRPRAEQEGNIFREATGTAQLLSVTPPPREAVVCLDEWVGPGYSLPTPEMADAVRMAAAYENILLDPVYTGKAMAGLIGLARRGELKGERVLFLHTGGAPALHVYADVLARGIATEHAPA